VAIEPQEAAWVRAEKDEGGDDGHGTREVIEEHNTRVESLKSYSQGEAGA